VAEEIDPCLRSLGTFGVENVDADMGVDQKRITRSEHEQGGVEIKNAFIQEDVAVTENIAQEHDHELQEQHGKRCPAQHVADEGIDALQHARESFHCGLSCP